MYVSLPAVTRSPAVNLIKRQVLEHIEILAGMDERLLSVCDVTNCPLCLVAHYLSLFSAVPCDHAANAVAIIDETIVRIKTCFSLPPTSLSLIPLSHGHFQIALSLVLHKYTIKNASLKWW